MNTSTDLNDSDNFNKAEEQQIIKNKACCQGKNNSTPKVVAYVTSIGISAEAFLKPHFDALKSEGYNVILFCSDDESASRVKSDCKIAHVGVPIAQNISISTDIKALFKLWRAFLKLKPNVVHSHMSKAGFIGTIAAFFAGVKTRIYHNHGMKYFSASGKQKVLLGCIEWVTSRLATEVIFCSESTKEIAIQTDRTPSKKAKVIGNGTISGINIEKFVPAKDESEKNACRKALGLPTDKIVVGFVGRLVPHKGVTKLLDAWGKIVDKNSCLAIAGSKDDEDLSSRVENESKNSDNFFYLGRRNDMPNVYKAFDILVLPSDHEGFPYSVLEAQSCGIPAIVSGVTGNTDAVVNGETGIIVNDCNADNLSTAITDLTVDKELRDSMGEKARKRIEEQFSENSVIGNLIKFYGQRL